MNEPTNMHSTSHLQSQLDRLGNGEPDSSRVLLELSMRRLQLLAKRISRNIPGVMRWEQTDDLLQNSIIRLWRALEKCRPATPVEFYRLASSIMRRELIDLSRHYFGAEGIGANLIKTKNAYDQKSISAIDSACDETSEPNKLAQWTEFHEYVESLEDETKLLFDLMWYQGLTLAQAAEVLESTERTTRRRWKMARLELYETLYDSPLADGDE